MNKAQENCTCRACKDARMMKMAIAESDNEIANGIALMMAGHLRKWHCTLIPCDLTRRTEQA